jgi:hypothetical protein
VTTGREPGVKAQRAQEWQQFRLLSRDSVRRLLNTALFSPDADPDQFALWGLALVTVPPFLFSVRQMMMFPFFDRAPAPVVERMVTSGRVFFLAYGMMAAALLAALTWEALFPTRSDQEVLGTLPVRPRTFAGARLAAAAMVAGVLTAVIALPSAVIYSLATSTHPLAGPLPRIFAGHVCSLVLGCAFAFFALMSIRGLVAICAGERIAERLATLLQIVTIVGLLETFLFLPAVLSTLVDDLLRGGTGFAWLPPVWFGALYAVIADGGRPHFVPLAQTAVLATLASTALAIGVSLIPARMMSRRAQEARTVEGGRGLVFASRAIAAALVRRASVRAVFLFAIASLASSRRHRLILSMHVGLAIAISLLIPATGAMRGTFSVVEPTPGLLAAPLAFLFFLIFGLRSSLAVPTLLEANWTFRLTPPSVPHVVSAVRLVIVLVGVLPIVAATAIVGASLWPARVWLPLTALDGVAGLCLVEGALLNWTGIPFASAHNPSTETMKSRWLIHGFWLVLFVVPLANLQGYMLDAGHGSLRALAGGAAVLMVLRLVVSFIARRRSVVIDLPWEGPELPNLSHATE